MTVVPHIPRSARYTIGVRIEHKYLNLLEGIYHAYFTNKERKGEKLTECILILDTLKFLMHVAWEAKLLSHKHYEDNAFILEEVGKMLGGWKRNLDTPEKKNRTL